MQNLDLSEMSLEELNKLRKKQLVLFFIVALIGTVIVVFIYQYFIDLNLPIEEYKQKITFTIIPVVILETFIYLAIVFKLKKITSQMRKLGWVPDNEK